MTGGELRRRTIGVLHGGRSAERAISLESGRAVLAALRERGFRAAGIDVGPSLARDLAAAGVEVAWIALHGRWGEDGCVQGLLECLDIPYTGSGVLASALAMDKVTAKRLFTEAGLATPPWRSPVDAGALDALGAPLVVKPRREGSSVGLALVRDAAALAEVLAGGDPAALLAEPFVPGREISVGVLGEGAAARALGTVEVVAAADLFDYAAKYESEATRHLVPAPLDPDVDARVRALAVAAHVTLGCAGATRVDIRMPDAGEPTLLEVNTVPGMTPLSLLPEIAASAGLDFGDLVVAILEGAALRA